MKISSTNVRSAFTDYGAVRGQQLFRDLDFFSRPNFQQDAQNAVDPAVQFHPPSHFISPDASPDD